MTIKYKFYILGTLIEPLKLNSKQDQKIMHENQSWTSTEDNMKVCSPMTNMCSPMTAHELKTCLSFASIKHHKLFQQLQTPRHSTLKMGVTCRTGQKQNKKSLMSTKQKQKKQRRQIQDYSQMRNNDKVIRQSLQTQNQSLKATVEILKQQVSALNSSYKVLKKQNQALKQKEEQNKLKLASVQKQMKDYKNKNKQYEDIMPKIEQLQQLQDVMIEQNSQLKRRQALLKDLLTQIVIMTASSSDDTALHIRNLINTQFNKL